MREKCSLVGKDDSAKSFSLPTTVFPSSSFWFVSLSQKHLSPENYCFQHLCEKNLLNNDWKRMWEIAVGGGGGYNGWIEAWSRVIYVTSFCIVSTG
jgi:hypothetical protein